MEKDIPSTMRFEHAIDGLVCVNPTMKRLIAQIDRIANEQLHILLIGETGTGKGLLAEVIHQCSKQHNYPFIPYNCGTGPHSLFESQLFGHKKGAFSGADYDQPGLVEEADGGTLFLDEINSLDMCSQVKLNFFLETGCFRRVGECKLRKINVRIISASNADLKKEIKKRRFRIDLYYRLAKYELNIPPLRERRDDIIPLVQYFLKNISFQKEQNPMQFSTLALQSMMKYNWPGNVRELEHFVTRSVFDNVTETIDKIDLPQNTTQISSLCTDEYLCTLPWKEAKKNVIASFEKKYLKALLQHYHGIVARCARHAQVHAPDFWQLMKKYNLKAKDFR